MRVWGKSQIMRPASDASFEVGIVEVANILRCHFGQIDAQDEQANPLCLMHFDSTVPLACS
jgi:hypothetical protein